MKYGLFLCLMAIIFGGGFLGGYTAMNFFHSDTNRIMAKLPIVGEANALLDNTSAGTGNEGERPVKRTVGCNTYEDCRKLCEDNPSVCGKTTGGQTNQNSVSTCRSTFCPDSWPN